MTNTKIVRYTWSAKFLTIIATIHGLMFYTSYYGSVLAEELSNTNAKALMFSFSIGSLYISAFSVVVFVSVLLKFSPNDKTKKWKKKLIVE
jgi:hypothetical protein